MVKNEQIDVISQVAVRLAHEIRNPLTTVKGFLQIMMLNSISLLHKDYFEIMLSEVNAACQSITEMLYLDNNRVLNLLPCNLNDIIKKTVPLLNKHLEEKIITLNIEQEILPLIPLDEKEISVLIRNLSVNGIEAMDSGTLHIRTFEIRDKIVLQVKDEGNGIGEEIVKDIGKPLVSTKDNMVGMGLAICFGIVNKHNAEIEFETGKKGTTFSIYFKK